MDELKVVRDKILEQSSSLDAEALTRVQQSISQLEEKVQWVQQHLAPIQKDIDSLPLKEIHALYQQHYHGLSKAIAKQQSANTTALYAELAQRAVQAPASDQSPNSPAPAETDKLSLALAWDKYMDEMARAGNWAKASQREYEIGKSVITDLLQDPPLQSIDKASARRLKTLLGSLPKNVTKKAKFKGLSRLQAATLEHSEDTISTTTINKHLNQLKTIMKWCIDNGYYSGANPVDGLSIRQKRKSNEARLPFDQSDLSKIFNHKIFTDEGKRFRNTYKFWVPLLALFSGARINEICQLYIDDISLNTEIPSIRITDAREDQSLKNSYSQREIPIHSELLRIGIEGYVEYLQQSGQQRLFPDITLSRDGYGSAPSKAFNRMIRSLGISDKKVFHSFRHTFSDSLKNKEVQEAIVSDILGHHHSSMTFGNYGSSSKLSTMKSALEQLPFTDITAHISYHN
ncbi:MAG: site-specific integrase [Oceanospirillales bacterium]|nr:site-specific integrase [Oceanospirillales bacterium]